MKNELSSLDKTLQELALADWAAFCAITKIDLVQAAICLERDKGRSYQAIGNKMKITKQAVAERCKKCDPDAGS